MPENITDVGPDGGEGLLAVIVRDRETFSTPLEIGISFLTPPEAPMQLGVMQRPCGYIVARHVHLPMKRQLQGTSETLLVISGRIRIDVYTSAREWVASVTLLPGDIIVLLNGGHSVEFLEASRVLEVKQGPYLHGDDKGGW